MRGWLRACFGREEGKQQVAILEKASPAKPSPAPQVQVLADVVNGTTLGVEVGAQPVSVEASPQDLGLPTRLAVLDRSYESRCACVLAVALHEGPVCGDDATTSRASLRLVHTTASAAEQYRGALTRLLRVRA